MVGLVWFSSVILLRDLGRIGRHNKQGNNGKGNPPPRKPDALNGPTAEGENFPFNQKQNGLFAPFKNEVVSQK